VGEKLEIVSKAYLSLYVFFETLSKDDVNISLNEVLADAYIEKFNYIKQKYNLKDNISLSLLMEVEDIITVEKNLIDEDIIIQTLMPAVDMALDEFIKLRQTEGAALKEDILIKLENISKLVNQIKVRSPKVVIEYKNKLQSRLNELLVNIKLDEARLITEVTIFADRCSVDEEVTRLLSHINQMKSTLDQEEPVGKKLDFLVQEMNREANTIASKSNDLEITQITVDLKSEIEKIREQVQNIE